MSTPATLNGFRVTDATITIPAWGAWYADVTIDGSHPIVGAVTLVIADATFKGFVLTGGPANAKASRSYFRVVGGAGAWGKEIPAKSYANDAGVKRSAVLLDAAAACGESFDQTTLPTDRLDAAFVRSAAPACRVLEVLSPSAWYVDLDGQTRIGARAAKAYTGKATIHPVNVAKGSVEVQAETIAALVPGVIVSGITAVDVEHEVSTSGIKTTLYGKAPTSRRLAALRALFDQLDPDRNFRALWEYRVVTLSGNRANLQPVRVSTGMPDLQRVIVRPGVSGAKSTIALGSRVLVTFVDADPSRPIVVGFEDADGSGFLPTTTTINASTLVTLGDGSDYVALAALVETALTDLKSAISGATTGLADGGAQLKATILAALSAWPAAVAASKVKAS